MLDLFRRLTKSRFGVFFALGFLVLIAFAFASSDVANNSLSGGGVTGADSVAVVGDTTISASDLSRALSNELDDRRQTEPTLTMEAMLAGGAGDRVVEELIQRAAINEWARKHGLRASKRLVDSELVKITAFLGPDGKFDRDAFDAVLRQRSLTEASVRDDLSSGLVAQQLLVPATFGTTVPQALARQYAQLLRERRMGAIATLPSAVFAPEGDPTSAQLAAYHKANGDDYIRPERRVIRYATFGDEAIGTIPAPTEAQIAARFEQDKAQYSASETRTFSQMIVPTEAAAKAIMAEIAGGKAMTVSAREKGLATAQIGPVTKSQLAGQASQAVANAAFAAAQGAIAAPSRGSLGWYILKVDAITRTAARSLADARGEISSALAAEQRRAAFIDMATRIEEEFENGSSIEDVAAELRIQLKSTRPITADGAVYGTTDRSPPELAKALQAAFAMDEGEPQIAETVAGQTFLVFGVGEITPSAVAPLGDIRADVVADWRQSEGARLAKAAADRILKRVAGGQALGAALAAETVALPAPQAISMGREDLARLGRTPPPLALLFSMARGSVKKLEGPRDAGWFVVRLDDIAVPVIADDDTLIGQTKVQLAKLYSDEYAEQMIRAALAEVGSKKNQPAIDAVIRQLTGSVE